MVILRCLLNPAVGTKMVWVAVIGDWFNLIFKWILFGHRPYWWVQETMIYPNQAIPCLEQFPITCETGPGTLSAEAFEHTSSIQTSSLKTYIKANAFLFFSALGFYLDLELIDIALLWSVPKAKKWCANPEWVTTPFAGLVRNVGALFGLGLSIHSEMFVPSCKVKCGHRGSFRRSCTAASLAILQLYAFIKIPARTEYFFYVLSFCKSAAVPLTVVALVPYCVHVLMKSTAGLGTSIDVTVDFGMEKLGTSKLCGD
uniref:glucose-6-phosphatase 2 n=1 Tax=Euleptes europaea TaxID=460621 RepID=UPI00254213F3|nr:glucose-6-phosphatase 2 [Euleptes europaea]